MTQRPPERWLRVLVTGGGGVLGRALVPLLRGAGHDVRAPSHAEVDLLHPPGVREAVRDVDVVYHLATRIPPPERMGEPSAWRENDRLRADATRLLVDAALASVAEAFVMPTVTFVYPAGDVDESTPVGDVPPFLMSALTAEQEVARFASAGRRGVVLRLGVLDGPGTGNDRPVRDFGATLHVDDAGQALLAAIALPSGIYNAVRDGERVSNRRLRQAAGWRPRE